MRVVFCYLPDTSAQPLDTSAQPLQISRTHVCTLFSKSYLIWNLMPYVPFLVGFRIVVSSIYKLKKVYVWWKFCVPDRKLSFPCIPPCICYGISHELTLSDQSFPQLQNRTNAVKQEASVCPAAIGGPFKILNRSERPETISEKRFCGLCYVIGSHVALAFIQIKFQKMSATTD